MGGTVVADLHEDFVLPQPDLLLDDELVIEGGEWSVWVSVTGSPSLAWRPLSLLALCHTGARRSNAKGSQQGVLL
jgi:hypothetical protein